MKNSLLLVILFFSINYGISQNESSDKFISFHLTYYPPIKEHLFFRQFEVENERLLLEYLTRTSGEFEIIEFPPRVIDNTVRQIFPTNAINVGFSFGFMNSKYFYFEGALTKLNSSSSEYRETYCFTSNSSGNNFCINEGSVIKNFNIAMRFTFGKSFGRNKYANFKFGLFGAIEPAFYKFQRRTYSSAFFPIDANLLSIELGIIPKFSFRLSKKVFFEININPNLTMLEIGNSSWNNPNIQLRDQSGSNSTDIGHFNFNVAVQLKYLINGDEGKRKRRK